MVGLEKLLLLLIVVASLMACTDNRNEERLLMATNQVNADEWQAVAQKRILFGHQSVGSNILSGVQSLASQTGLELGVIESRSASEKIFITHFKIGQNGNPLSKIKDFEDTLTNGAAQGIDIALMKFCYIDITDNTDVEKLAEAYSSSLNRLSQQFPKTIFIAVTVPITSVQSGPKAWLKRLAGRPPGGYAENFRRQEFNTILRNSYGRQGRLFDLASFEAEGADNHQHQDQRLEVMNKSITSDGGHLNTFGEQFVAAKLLKFIAASSYHP